MLDLIYILTGPVHSGKTTRLFEWIKDRADVAGILSPVIEHKRFFFDIQTKNHFEMEAGESAEEVLSIGRYRFQKQAFVNASKIIREVVNQKGWLIIDEAGPLELNEQGLYEVIKEILYSKTEGLKILVVVRNSIVDRVVDFFSLSELTARLIISQVIPQT